VFVVLSAFFVSLALFTDASAETLYFELLHLYKACKPSNPDPAANAVRIKTFSRKAARLKPDRAILILLREGSDSAESWRFSLGGGRPLDVPVTQAEFAGGT